MRREHLSRHEFLQKAVDMLQEEWQTYHRILSCPVFFNITNFHLYNATYGFRQGDLCLQHIEGILQDTFPGRPLTHLGADNFAVLANASDVQPHIDEACRRVQAFIGNPNIALKAGIRFLMGVQSLEDLNSAFDGEAKVACDTIKKDASRHWAVYTEELGLHYQMQNYVREYLDQALEKGFIRVYLQPVIRTLTGELVSAEALARWESPQYGTISPGIFIPVLEEAHLVHKLDAYVLHAIARMLRRILDRGIPPLPVSVNLSRLDFLLQDPFAVAETFRKKYRLPAELLQIEITENVLVDRMEPVLDGLRQFQEAGYPVLLDDFGSGYSSLNVMKDYDFDTIKFDMKFLHPFTEKSRKILKYLVSMAKDLSLHTLAEGAETKEQCDFLREIGCEKIQGYYYGRPIPYEEFHAYCRDKGLHLESRDDAKLLDKAGLVDLNQSIPVAILRDDRKELLLLQANDHYLDTLHSIGTPSLQRANMNMRSKNFPMNEKFRRFLDRILLTGQEETMTYVDNGQYLRVKARPIASVGKTTVYEVGLYNISDDRAMDDADSHRFDRLVRNLTLAYDGIWYCNIDEDHLDIIESLTSVRVGTQFQGVATAMRQFAGRYVHPADRERFLTFIDPASLYERASASPQSFTASIFRVLRHDGHYDWLFFICMALVKSTSRELLICLCQDLMPRLPERYEILRHLIDSYGIAEEFFAAGPHAMGGAIWNYWLKESDIEFFWKDRQHRFRGASQAFLKGRGVLDVKEIIGKTNEELGWLLHAPAAHASEEQVMQTGEPLHDVIEELNIGHRVQKIRVSKYPLREGGKVVGIFIKVDSLKDTPERQARDMAMELIDKETHLLSYSGMIMDGLKYADEYRLHGDDYTALLLDVPEYDAIGMKYGQSFRQHLLQKIVALLHQELPVACSVSRIGSSCFLIFAKSGQDPQLMQAVLKIATGIHAIHEVDGRPCDLFLHYAQAHGSEVRSIDSVLRLLVKRLQRAEETRYGAMLYSNDNIIFPRELFDQFEFAVIIDDPNTHDVLYLNRAMRRELGMTPDAPLDGKKCYELMAGLNGPCENCYLRKLRQSGAYTDVYHNDVTGADLLLCHTLVPWNGRYCHFCMCINLDYYADRHASNDKILYEELSINDLLRAGMYETNPEHGIRKMMNRIGNLLDADQVLIAEEDAMRLHFSYIWTSPTALPLAHDILPFARVELQPLYEKFAQHSVFTIDDVEQFSRDTGYAPHLPNLRRLVFARLRLDGTIYGYIEIINPAPEQMQKAVPLLKALVRFFSILLRNRNLMQRIDRLSKLDPLTGIMNRRGLLDVLKELPTGHLYAFFFGDLNGLKETNDQLGHDAGDRLIQSAANVFTAVCPTKYVFRMGGDEFLMLQKVSDEQEAATINERLHNHFRTSGISISLGFSLATSPIENIDGVLAEADHHMYQEKIQHHKTRHQHRATEA